MPISASHITHLSLDRPSPNLCGIELVKSSISKAEVGKGVGLCILYILKFCLYCVGGKKKDWQRKKKHDV